MKVKGMTTYRNTHKFIDEYIKLIKKGKMAASKEVHLLINLVKSILNRDDVYIDHEAVDKSVEIPGRYFPFKLYPWQKFVNVFIYGLRWKRDDTLVFDRYFLYMGRGAGKNGYISWNSFYMMTKQHGIRNYHIDIVATSEDQAKTSFEDVYNVLEDNESRLGKAFDRTLVKIESKSTKSRLIYNTSNARTKDGKRVGCVIFDEEHEYENYDSIKVFTSAGGKIDDYREFHISTDGNVRGGPLDDLKKEAQMLLNGELTIEDTTLFPFMCRLDDPKEVDNEDMWTKANPSLPYDETLKRKMRSEYTRMQINSAIRLEFMTKRMNRPVEDVRTVVATYDDVLSTNKPLPEKLKGITAIGGVDFADVRDFCSVGLLFKHDGKRYWIQHTFVHHLALELQDINEDIIELGKEKGLISIIHNEKSINPDRVVNWFLEQLRTFNIKKVSMDDYRAAILGPKLEEAGFEVERVRRGRITHGKLDPLIQDMFINQTIIFGDDPVMRWYVGNVYKDEQGNGNMEYKKIDKERRKTDGFFAFTHALNFDGELKDAKAITKENVKKIIRSYNY